LGGAIKIKVPEDSAFLNFCPVNRRVCPFWHWVAANIFDEKVLLRLVQIDYSTQQNPYILNKKHGGTKDRIRDKLNNQKASFVAFENLNFNYLKIIEGGLPECDIELT